MSSTQSTPASRPSWTNWPPDAKRRLLQAALRERWQLQARAEQLPPEGDWRTWYVRGGRGAGKTRTGAETLAGWLLEFPGDYAIVAPTAHDVKSVCVEGAESGLLRCLGGERGGLVRGWNRSEGVVYLENGAKVFVDGGDDGALRIQGKNLHGAWCDEVGLWEKWDLAWNYSLRPAIRFEPARIIATGTPKMGHPLIAYLLEAPKTAHTHMRTVDNLENLYGSSIEAMMEEWQGTLLGRQELEGEYIAAMEGEVLPRGFWQWYSPELSFYGREFDFRAVAALPKFDKIVHSWDTALKDKSSACPTAGQVWGCKGPDRYLLRVFHERASLNVIVEAMWELRSWSGKLWPHTPTFVLVENTANGPEAIAEMRRRVDGVKPITVKGDKAQRALAAAVALETHHCWLPGYGDPTPGGSGYDSRTPGHVQSFVEECAMFRGDLKHKSHDDQVDAWSQMVNWTRQHGRPARVSVPSMRVPPTGALAGVDSWDRVPGV